MKEIISLISSCLFFFALISCEGGDDSQSAIIESPPAPEELVVLSCPTFDPTPPALISLPNTLPAGDLSITVDAGMVTGNLTPVWRDHYDLSLVHLNYTGEAGFSDLVTSLNPRYWRISVGRWEISMPAPSGSTSDDGQTLIQVEREFYRGGNTLDDADEPSNYNFTYLEEQFEALIGLGAIPFVSFDYMPYTLARVQDTDNTGNMFRSMGSNYSFSNGIRTSPPADPAVYARVVRNTIRHMLGLFPSGGKNYGTTFFEIGNEPEFINFWNGTRQEWISMYNAIAAEVEADPDLENVNLGGGSFALPDIDLITDLNDTTGNSPTFVRQFLTDVAEKGTRLDFLSFHSYNNNPDMHFDSMNYVRTQVDMNKPTAAIINGEWGLDITNGVDAIYDSIQHGLFRAKVIMMMQIIGVHMAHEALLRDLYTQDCQQGQLSLLTTGPAGHKPVSDLYRGLNMMNDNLQALQITSPSNTFVMAGKDISDSKIVVMFVAEDPGAESTKNVNITIHNLPWGLDAYSVKRYEVSEATHADEQGVKLVESISFMEGDASLSVEYSQPQLMIWELVKE